LIPAGSANPVSPDATILLYNNNNIDNFNDIELWSNQEMDQLIFRTILDANAHRLIDAKNCFVQQVRPIVDRGIIPQEHRTKAGGSR